MKNSDIATIQITLAAMVQRAKVQRAKAVAAYNAALALDKKVATYYLRNEFEGRQLLTIIRSKHRVSALVCKWRKRAELTTRLLVDLQMMQSEGLPITLQQQASI